MKRVCCLAATVMLAFGCSSAWPADDGVLISRCEFYIRIVDVKPLLSYQRISADEDLAKHEATIEYETQDAAGVKARSHAVCRFDEKGQLNSRNVNGQELQVVY